MAPLAKRVDDDNCSHKAIRNTKTHARIVIAD
eukprot:CAMPEP_0172895528 /NCGR_PEP_ID=MMETSP1075-20121228/153302_1 /TAXON_ID=2916 /ORGANISM="Ceratium fusus, Strain PA161109" /LENGTH=31 /DNA_ID= /DNA_START= /DNA_END= /DNA_ORIENTATION=